MTAIDKNKLDMLLSDNANVHITSPAPDETCSELINYYPEACHMTSAKIIEFRNSCTESMKNIDIVHYLLNKKMLILNLSDDDLRQDDLWKLILFLLHSRKYELPARGHEGYTTIIVSDKSKIYNMPPVLLGPHIHSSAT
ncbi:MAG: hypothetical protein ACI4XJ_03185 [Eubacteriales bacterium]